MSHLDKITLTKAQIHQLRALVYTQLLADNDWRHHGVGMIQTYVNQPADMETRIHIWDPSLTYPDLKGNGDVHDHRFDFIATVLLGKLYHQLFRVITRELGPHKMATVAPCRTVIGDPEFCNIEPCVLHLTGEYTVGCGEQYEFAKRSFHSAMCDELTITLMTKYSQDKTPARVVGRELKPAFREVDRNLINTVLNKAKHALMKSIQ